jgi:hypothetical protein
MQLVGERGLLACSCRQLSMYPRHGWNTNGLGKPPRPTGWQSCAPRSTNATATGVFVVTALAVDSNQSALRSSQFSRPSFGSTKCLPIFRFDIERRLPFWPPQRDEQIRFAGRSIYVSVAGNDSGLRNRRTDRFNHRRICLRARQRRLVSIPFASARPWRRRKLQARSRPKKIPAQDNRPVQPISSFVRTNSSAASAAARELFP